MVERHVADEDAFLADHRLREAVAIVPRLDGLNPFGRIAGLIAARALEIGVELQDIFLGESEHGVELRILRDVRCDVETAREVVHRHG